MVYKEYRTGFTEWICSTQKIQYEEALEIYQQTILVFYENIVNGRLRELKSNIRTYLFAIGKNKVKEYRRHNRRNTEISEYEAESLTENKEENARKERMISVSNNCIELLGDPCKKLLILYYYHKRSMKEISAEMGYKNENTTKNQKYKCLEKLRSLISNKLNREEKLEYGLE